MNKFRGPKNNQIPIPDSRDWGQIPKDDLDMLGSHTDYFGKSCSEIVPKFLSNPISMIDSLRWMPHKPFVFYFRCLAATITNGQANASAGPDLASSFLRLIEEKAQSNPLAIRANMAIAREVVGYIASNQKHFNAKPEIYGNFVLIGERINALLDKI